VGSEFLALTGDLFAIDETFNLLSRVTVADVKRVAAQYFARENRTVVVLDPETP
jgi:predicted Zn-dependent peptidase